MRQSKVARLAPGVNHHLTNETPAKFDPNPIFSETAYLRRNDDVAAAVNERRVRSGYHHYIADGVREHRFFKQGHRPRQVCGVATCWCGRISKRTRPWTPTYMS